MAIKKTTGGWQVDIQPEGRGGRRVRRTFKTQAEARRFENVTRSRASTGEYYLPVKDLRRLSDLIDLWHSHHGHTLKSVSDRMRRLHAIADRLGNPIAKNLTSKTWAEYRSQRLHEIKPSTVNHEQAFLHSVFSELERLGLWLHGNPLARMRQLRVDDSEMAFLDEGEITLLLDNLRGRRTDHAYWITLLCLSTGARWSEAETLRGENVRQGRVTFVRTKTGKTRTVPIRLEFAERLNCRKPVGRLFQDAYTTFQRAIAETGIVLPPGQLTHVLRHTFASHFMMNGGNILVLQRVLGHQSIQMTMRYAHFAPDHLEEAVKLNPVKALTLC